MKTFFQDNFINKRILSRLVKEIKKDQLDSTIDELENLNRMQSQVISSCDFSASQNENTEFIKKVNNARRKNI